MTTPGFAAASATGRTRHAARLGDPQRNRVDGIVLDALGNPAAYHILRTHPGSAAASPHAAFDTLPAADVLHWFRADRPGLHRGLPDILPALPLFAQLRRYTLAVIAAAESAANVAIFMKTTAPPGGEAAEVEPAATMELEPNMAVFGPEGWEPSQIRAEQPATGYAEFKREILNEIARCLNLPYNIAACNSSGYNYASGRLDHQTYYKSIRVEQSHLATAVLDRILAAWLAEAEKALGIELPALGGTAALGPVRRPPRPLAQGHEDLLGGGLPQLADGILDRRVAAGEAFAAEDLPHPLDRVPLLAGQAAIGLDQLAQHAQPRPDHRLVDLGRPPIARRGRMVQHPLERVPVKAEPPAGLPLGDPLNQHRTTNVRPLLHVRIHSRRLPSLPDGPFRLAGS